MGSLPEYRSLLSRDMRTGGENGASARAHLADLALTFLTKLAKGNYHPAVRCNAMLAIGELCAQTTGPGHSLQPLPAALKVMIDAVKSADQIDAVKSAALVGILRHAALGISNRQYCNQEVVPAMLTIATTRVSPGRSPEGHAWIRARAIDVLGEIGSVGSQNSVVGALAEMVANAETPFMIRCAAARALGKLRYDPNAKLDAHHLAAQVARLAADALAYEVDQKLPDLEAMLQSRQSGSMIQGFRGGTSGSPGMFGPRTVGAARPTSTPVAVQTERTRARNRTAAHSASTPAGPNRCGEGRLHRPARSGSQGHRRAGHGSPSERVCRLPGRLLG